MFKVIALMTMCVVCGVTSSPTVLSAKPVVDLELQPPRLPGVENLAEKRISPPSDSRYSSYSPLPGTRNNAERIQVEPPKFRGTENLREKAIPQDVIARMSQNRKY